MAVMRSLSPARGMRPLRGLPGAAGFDGRLDESSTDANIPISLGLDAVSIGAGGTGEDGELMQKAAQSLGASGWTVFRRIELPLVLPGVAGVQGEQPVKRRLRQRQRLPQLHLPSENHAWKVPCSILLVPVLVQKIRNSLLSFR